MIDKTITSALLALRKQIIWDGLDGLEHVNALLMARGIDPAGLNTVPRQLAQACARRGIQMLVLASLRTGPKTHTQIATALVAARPSLEPGRVAACVYRAVYKLSDKGLVRREGRLWGMARQGFSALCGIAPFVSVIGQHQFVTGFIVLRQSSKR